MVRIRGGGSSLSRAAPEAVAAKLERGCREVLAAVGAEAGECVGVCGGFASAGANHGWYEAELRRLLPRARVQVMTDAELAWRAASGGSDGLVVISGTGSIVWGAYGGRQARAGGQGPGQDPGSGDWIGREAVRAGLAAAPADGNFAGLVPELAALSSPAGEELFRHAGIELAQLLLACTRELQWSAPIVFYAGGVLNHVPQVLAALAGAWPHALAALPRPPVEAALGLAG